MSLNYLKFYEPLQMVRAREMGALKFTNLEFFHNSSEDFQTDQEVHENYINEKNFFFRENGPFWA